MNIAQLIAAYRTDKDSTYRKLRYRSRLNYDDLCKRIERDYGQVKLKTIKARALKRGHEDWSASGVHMAHSLVGMLRTLVNFGATILEDEQCERLAVLLHRMKFKMGGARKEMLTAEQASSIRAMAHRMGRPSIALAQALQFECMLRQKDIIGEWVPIAEPEISDVIDDGWKWLRGLRWSEIDDNLILRHVTSKRGKEIEVDLKLMPMVMHELIPLGDLARAGPIIICEASGMPWSNHEFRRWWRKVARAAGIPDAVKNMDTRAGAISEASMAGAVLEHISQAATHSNTSTTRRYSRGDVENAAGVARARVAYRQRM